MQVRSIVNADGTISPYEAPTSSNSSSFGATYDEALKKLDASDLEKIYKRASETFGVSEDILKAVTMAESCFHVDSTSKSGAMGLMQLMPYTCEELGVTKPYDPEQNVFGGAKLLARYLDQFNGNVAYAVAAYNAGGNAVEKYGGIPPYEQTQKYVLNVMGYLENGGVDIPEDWMALLRTDGSWDTESLAGKEETELTEKEKIMLALKELGEKVFSYDDYLDFLKLFIEVVQAKLDQKLASQAVAKDEAIATDSSSTSSDEKKKESESQTSEAYIAYKNMASANKSFIYLNPLNKLS